MLGYKIKCSIFYDRPRYIQYNRGREAEAYQDCSFVIFHGDSTWWGKRLNFALRVLLLRCKLEILCVVYRALYIINVHSPQESPYSTAFQLFLCLTAVSLHMPLPFVLENKERERDGYK